MLALTYDATPALQGVDSHCSMGKGRTSSSDDGCALRNEFLAMCFRSDYKWLADRLRFRLGCRHAAEDVSSEAFVQLAAISDVSAVREPRALLTTIAQRIIFEQWRRKDLEKAYLQALALEPQRVQVSVEEQALVLESLLAIDRALGRLSEKARTAFLHSQLDGMTYAEIGQKLGVSARMVREYMAKALAACYEVAAA